MTHDEWCDFRRRCLKPEAERLGTWTARRIGRPAALRITRIVAPWGATAHQATAAAALAGLGAILAFGWGTVAAWIVGTALLAAWYVLDHIDGQLARLHATASLDGTTLDYAMHHSVNVLLPAAVGFGLFRQTAGAWWIVCGLAWGWGGLLIGLRHDARYKSFVQRLKLMHGELTVVGGGGGRPEPGAMPRSTWRSCACWSLLKACETHVVVGVLASLAMLRGLWPEIGLMAAQIYAACMASAAAILGPALLIRGALRGEAEREFAAWYRVAADHTLEFRDGWWHVECEQRAAGVSPAGSD